MQFFNRMVRNHPEETSMGVSFFLGFSAGVTAITSPNDIHERFQIYVAVAAIIGQLVHRFPGNLNRKWMAMASGLGVGMIVSYLTPGIYNNWKQASYKPQVKSFRS